MTDITVHSADSAEDDAARETDRPYRPCCPVCGASVMDAGRHRRWHEKLGDAVGQPGSTATS